MQANLLGKARPVACCHYIEAPGQFANEEHLK
jgi:hypothetical protein